MTKEKLAVLLEQATDLADIAEALQNEADEAQTQAETAWQAWYTYAEEPIAL